MMRLAQGYAKNEKWAASLTPDELLVGATSWREIAFAGRSVANGTIQDRRRFYWTVRFSVWDAARYVADWTAAYAQAWSPDLGMFVNFNK